MAAGETIIQVRTVLLIAAGARKLIILDLGDYSANTILALAAVVVGLGVTYWLVRDRDERQAARLAAAASR